MSPDQVLTSWVPWRWHYDLGRLVWDHLQPLGRCLLRAACLLLLLLQACQCLLDMLLLGHSTCLQKLRCRLHRRLLLLLLLLLLHKLQWLGVQLLRLLRRLLRGRGCLVQVVQVIVVILLLCHIPWPADQPSSAFDVTRTSLAPETARLTS